MLENTFCHIRGIGPETEKRLWDAGIYDWHFFIHCRNHPFHGAKSSFVTRELADSIQALDAGNASYFYDRLKAGEHWRMFKHFRNTTAYIDIETTGLDKAGGEITTIALYDGVTIVTYVNGRNLDSFIEDISAYDMLVTYNGKAFDIPFIESFFNEKVSHAHIDLRYVLNSLGFKGGLKNAERQLGISRNELEGVDGYFAVLLWHEFLENSNYQALDTLLAYNVEDVINLEFLMHHAYNVKIRKLGFAPELLMEIPFRPKVPYAADLKVVDEIRSRFFLWR